MIATDVTDLQSQLTAALARVNELETELASRPVKRTRKPARPVGEPCQYCGDRKTDKVLFLGLPMCNGADYAWRACAARMRRAKGTPGFAWDHDYSVRRANPDSPWVARVNGEVIGISTDREAMRRLAFDHRNNMTAAQAA